jgi:hypothetical protein
MGDEEAPQCKVEYLDNTEGPEETNWIKRAGRARVTYPNGCTFEGTFDAEKIKQGYGVYVWMGPAGGEDESMVEKARYEGNYKDGLKDGYGRMVFPSGDLYEGMWVQNRMEGAGTYTYKKTNDIYSGDWLNNKKHGQGRYEFGADYSVFNGTWENGQITSGSWDYQSGGQFVGNFKLGRPFGEGRFNFPSGLSQTGSYVVQKLPDEEEPAEGEPEKPPNVAWKGNSIVSF